MWIELAPLVFVRPSELRKAQWQDINFDTKEWRYYIKKTKVHHIVPLATQSVDILKEIYPVTGAGPHVFPSQRTPNGERCMSENTINAALKRLGYGKNVMTCHGFRAMARTILDEVLGGCPRTYQNDSLFCYFSFLKMTRLIFNARVVIFRRHFAQTSLVLPFTQTLGTPILS